MSLNKGPAFRERDIYIDYDFEDVKFRWDHQKEKFYRKFYDELEEEIVSHDNKLLNDAILSGRKLPKRNMKKAKSSNFELMSRLVHS